jgi:membrane-associated phospholipid phosphatase
VTRHIRVGVTLAAIAVALYALMWVGYSHHPLTGIDSATLRPLHDYGVRHHGWVWFWNIFCTVFGPTGFRLLGALVTVIAVLKRHLRAALFLVAAILLSGYVTELAKAIAHRPRPPEALVHAASSSFPSGHAMEVMAAVLALLTVSAGLAGHRLKIVLGALIVISVGVGRVVVNVHYPSDVLAGWALGYLWFFVCLSVIRPGR